MGADGRGLQHGSRHRIAEVQTSRPIVRPDSFGKLLSGFHHQGRYGAKFEVRCQQSPSNGKTQLEWLEVIVDL